MKKNTGRYPFIKENLLKGSDAKTCSPPIFFSAEANKLLVRHLFILKANSWHIWSMSLSLDVAVPVRLPVRCPHCNLSSRHIREIGSGFVIVITKDGIPFAIQVSWKQLRLTYSMMCDVPLGRFDLSCAAFRCTKCNVKREATFLDYIRSGFFPGSLTGSYLVSTDALESWFYSKHCTPGTSLLKFLEALGYLSKQMDRVYVLIFQNTLSIWLWPFLFILGWYNQWAVLSSGQPPIRIHLSSDWCFIQEDFQIKLQCMLSRHMWSPHWRD